MWLVEISTSYEENEDFFAIVDAQNLNDNYSQKKFTTQQYRKNARFARQAKRENKKNGLKKSRCKKNSSPRRFSIWRDKVI